MTRRNYKMTKRAAAVEETRRRIVRATLDLHAEQGVSNTGWEEIAARAEVGVGTVYRHFPTFDELLPACGALTWEKLSLPGPEIFDGATSREERLQRLIAAFFALYERGEAELRNIREEQGFHPALAEANGAVEARLDALVAAAVEDKRDLVRALTDLGTWRSLRDRRVGDPAGVIAGLLERALSE